MSFVKFEVSINDPEQVRRSKVSNKDINMIEMPKICSRDLNVGIIRTCLHIFGTLTVSISLLSTIPDFYKLFNYIHWFQFGLKYPQKSNYIDITLRH